ncbi:MAG: HD domain-containing protein, partial [Armatimonadota bacterium]|nr:HD domain-containing protein [Armatimonadota bacterium]
MNFFLKNYTELLLSMDGSAGGSSMSSASGTSAMSHDGDHICLQTIAVLADAIEAKDPYTRGHCQSVADISLRAGRYMGWSGRMLDQLRYAALLHDVGKIAIPDHILLKPERLLPEEFAIIQRHSRIGSDLVSRVPSLRP